MNDKEATVPLPIEDISSRILVIRGQRVMLDADLAMLYGVSTKALNQAVKRNLRRFPPDFMLQLTENELELLRSQIVTSKGRGGRRYAPYVFTEHGAVMLASVLNSDQAVDVSIFVVRAFVQLREMLSVHKELAAKFNELERKLSSHDQAIAGLINAIRQLMSSPEPKNHPIGFTAKLVEKGK